MEKFELCMYTVYEVKIPLCSSRHISTRHDTFDVSSQSRRACRAVRAVRQARHSQNTCRVVSRSDVTSQVEFWLYRSTIHVHRSTAGACQGCHHCPSVGLSPETSTTLLSICTMRHLVNIHVNCSCRHGGLKHFVG